MGRLNKVMLIGNFGGEIKMHHFDGGGVIGRVSLATTETYLKKDTNEKVSNTSWHNLVFRNKVAEIVEKHTKKGSKMYVEGRLKYTSWEKDGVKMYGSEIHVNEFEFLDVKTDQNKNTSSAGPTQPASSEIAPEEGDDLPF